MREIREGKEKREILRVKRKGRGKEEAMGEGNMKERGGKRRRKREKANQCCWYQLGRDGPGRTRAGMLQLWPPDLKGNRFQLLQQDVHKKITSKIDIFSIFSVGNKIILIKL